MKKLLFLILFVPVLSPAQTKKDIFNPNAGIVFFGADFTKVQFTKADEFNNKPDILRFFVDANNLITGSKRLVKSKLDRDTIGWDLSYITRLNAAVDWQKVFTDNIDYTVPESEIAGMIKNLNIDQAKYKDCIGLVFIEENMCKTKPLATASAVFFRINDLSPLLVKRYTVKPAGMGFLAYWGMTNGYYIIQLAKLKKEII